MHYLAIPQGLFGLVTRQLAGAGLVEGARVVVEKPFGTTSPRRGRSTARCTGYLRFRLSPDFVIALGAVVREPGEKLQEVELELNHVEGTDHDAYEELLGDALAGDSFRFARQDYVEEAWRVVDPTIQAGTPTHEYEPGTWGPKEAAGMVPGGWFVGGDPDRERRAFGARGRQAAPHPVD